MVIHHHKLDMIPGGVPTVVHVSQYDEDFRIEFQIYWSGNHAASYGASDPTVKIYGTKLDGNGYSADCSIVGQSPFTVAVEGDAQMTAIAGKNIFELAMFDEYSGRKVHSSNFILQVEPAALDGNTIVSESVVEEINQFLENHPEYYTAATDDIIIVDDDQPESVRNKLWIRQTEAEPIQIPTYEEFTGLKSSIPVEAELDDEGIATFYNEVGTSVFTLDLSELGGGGVSYSDVNVSANSIDMTEGETTTFTVVLADAPTGNQPVYVAVSDPSKLSVSPSSVWFTTSDWNQTKTVTVTALQDSDQTSETATITVSSRRVSSKQITVSITDDDYSIVETGLEAYWNYRDGTLTDSVKNITTTNGGTYQDHGLYTNDGSAKIQFIYPVQTANIPNGFTIEIAMVGFTSPVAAGTGSGSGYAYQSNGYNGYCWGGFFMYCDGAIRQLNNTQTQIKFDVVGYLPDLVDTSGEHIYAYVYHTDGSADMYVDGTHFGARLASANSDFERYNVSGNMTFKFPYFSDLSGSINLKEIRIYERDLSSTEIVQNYRATQSHQNEINFS